jgi:hypothetical protein
MLSYAFFWLKFVQLTLAEILLLLWSFRNREVVTGECSSSVPFAKDSDDKLDFSG